MSNTVSFIGDSLTLLLGNSNTFTAEALYSEWKMWLTLGDNAKYPPAFDTTGGDAVGSGQEIAPYFFLRNDLGWVIKMPQQDGELVMSGNLFPRDASQAMFVQAQNYDAFLRLEVSTRAVVIRVPVGIDGSSGGLTTEQNETLTKISNVTGLIPALL